MKFYFPIHLDGDNRGCEGIAKGTAQLLGYPKENLIGLCRDIQLDRRLEVDNYVTLEPKCNMSLLQRIIRKFISFVDSSAAVDYAYNAVYGAFLNEMKQGDIMLSTGGDMLCYNDNEVIYTNNFIHKKGLKSILWGCSVGKNNLTPAKIETLNNFSLIYTRESLTYELMKSLNLKNVILFPDPAFVLQPEQCALPGIFKNSNVVGINLSNYVVGGDNLNTPFGLEVKDGKIIVDESKLRYSKFIITADADVDGSHIRVLFLTFIWKFCPELLEKGYIYAAVPPLYKITQGTKIQYLKDDAALEQFRSSNSKKFVLGRMKGLGEMDPEEMAETVMNVETRTLKQITMEDATLVAQTFMSLMGESVGPRKKFIEDNAWRANIDV